MMFVLLAMIFVHLLPFAAAILLWRATYRTRLEWLARVGYVSGGTILLFLVGFWAFIAYPLRYVSLAALALGILLSWRKVSRLPFKPARNWEQWIAIGIEGSVAVGMASILIVAWRGSALDGPAVELLFPIRSGTYFIGQGGSTRIVNAHRSVREQAYALDITSLNTWGRHASGIRPTELASFAIFGDPVVSPCDGEIVDAVDSLPDLIPPDTDRKNTKGNHILVRCKTEGVDVLLAHLQRGSLRVGAGRSVQRGENLARVGNSGNTSEPHLHLQANRGKEPVPMTFGGRFLVRNDLVRPD